MAVKPRDRDGSGVYPSSDGDWPRYKKMVLQSLDKLDHEFEQLRVVLTTLDRTVIGAQGEINGLREDIARLEKSDDRARTQYGDKLGALEHRSEKQRHELGERLAALEGVKGASARKSAMIGTASGGGIVAIFEVLRAVIGG